MTLDYSDVDRIIDLAGPNAEALGVGLAEGAVGPLARIGRDLALTARTPKLGRLRLWISVDEAARGASADQLVAELAQSDEELWQAIGSAIANAPRR